MTGEEGRPLRLLVLLPDLADDAATRDLLGVVSQADPGTVAVESVAWDGGPLSADLRRHGPLAVVAELPGGGLSALAERVLFKVKVAKGGRAARRRRLGIGPWARHEPDAVYLSSPRAAPLLRYVPLGPPVVVMVPVGEMTPADHEPLSDEDRALLLARADRYLVQSDDSRRRLHDLGVAESAMVQIGEPLADPSTVAPSDDQRAEWRARLGVDAGASVIVGSGPVVWQGGTDLFVRMLWILRNRLDQQVAGVWVGAASDPLERRQLDHDITHMGLDGSMHVLGPEDTDALWLGDLHVLVSREPDTGAYRAVALRGQALVGFHAESLDRFVGDDAGRLYDFLDLEHLAAGIADLLDDDPSREALAARVADRFAQWHLPSRRPRAILRLIREAR